MSDAPRPPALSIWEFSSIAHGVHAADAIAKGSPVSDLRTGTTHPGKYVVMAAGDTASVDVANDIVADVGVSLVATRFLPDVADEVWTAITAAREAPAGDGDAIGVVETATVSSAVDAADAAVKAAAVGLQAIRLADGLGGKAYFIVDGSVGEVDAALAAAVDRAAEDLEAVVAIPQLTDDLRDDLAAAARFTDRIREGGRA